MYRALQVEDRYQALCQTLVQNAAKCSTKEAWPAESMEACGIAGVHRWFVDRDLGGDGWSEGEVIDGYLMLSRHCLTTAFILTQRTGAMKRIAGSGNTTAIERWLPELLQGTCFGTVGISHLTTSRQHLKQPALVARSCGPSRYRLHGYSPWVTGAAHADVLVVAAVTEQGDQILAAVPTLLPGVRVAEPMELIAVSGSCTGRVDFEEVEIGPDELLAGPSPDVMKQGVGAGTGGLQTTTLALGVSMAAIDFLQHESEVRKELSEVAQKLKADCLAIIDDLHQWQTPRCTPGELRQRANSMVLRSTQAALTAAKGAGFVEGHPVGRWAREALFFLVWSCPQPVLQANLCELAGL